MENNKTSVDSKSINNFEVKTIHGSKSVDSGIYLDSITTWESEPDHKLLQKGFPRGLRV
ncbi:caspase 3, isoform CRA_d [Mus musculus]|nr:caspase 3, isoform CRA_d [Mus musculus]